MAMKDIGMGMMKAKRINPLEILGGHKLKDLGGFHAMLDKAREIEDRRKGFAKQA
jgi:quinone-modifying oxidoreductase subunit QmoC